MIMRKIDEIIMHCSATAEGKDYRASDIDKWHKARGFRCIGYHYVVRLDGTVERGRPENEAGAHCLGHNRNSVGICYVGGCGIDGRTPKDTRTRQQKDALMKLVKEIRRKFGNIPVHGHREFANKACPCFDAAAEYGGVI